MAEKTTYPPAYIKPGEVIEMSAANGKIEIIGVYDDRVLDFFVSFVAWQQMHEAKAPSAQIEKAARDCATRWNKLPSATLTKVMERMKPGQIWLPERSDDNAG